jgi:hypothetical protein
MDVPPDELLASLSTLWQGGQAESGLKMHTPSGMELPMSESVWQAMCILRHFFPCDLERLCKVLNLSFRSKPHIRANTSFTVAGALPLIWCPHLCTSLVKGVCVRTPCLSTRSIIDVSSESTTMMDS